MNIISLFMPFLQGAATPEWELLTPIIVQFPLLVIFAWYVDRRDKQFLDRIDRLTEALNHLENRLAEITTAQAVAEQLADEFWGRGHDDRKSNIGRG